LQIVIVEYVRGQIERGARATQRDGHAVVRHRNRPEQTIRGDVRVVIVNLIRSNWTVVDVKSDESKRRMVMLAVDRDVLAHHEPHVGLKCRGGEARAHANAPDAIESDESVEVRDLRGVGDVRQRRADRTDGEMVNEDAEGRYPAGNRRWRAVGVRVAALSATGQSGTGDETGRRADKLSTRESTIMQRTTNRRTSPHTVTPFPLTVPT